jgi:hypothetical protein
MEPKLKATFQKCLLITGAFEGARYGGSVGNFDGAGMSFGILQWNLAQGTLQPLFSEMYSSDPTRFDEIAKDKSGEIMTMALAYDRETIQNFVNKVTTGKEFIPSKPSKKFYSGKVNILPEWKEVFANLGNGFKNIQDDATEHYFNDALKICKLFNLKTERSIAFAFDQSVQRGRGSISDEYQQYKEQAKEFITEKGVLQFILDNDLPDFSERWRDDVRNRRATIINGTGTVHGTSYDLTKFYGLSDAIILT